MRNFFHFTNETDKRVTMWIKDATSMVINTKWGSFDPGDDIPPWAPDNRVLYYWMEYWAGETKIATTDSLSVVVCGKTVRLVGTGGSYRTEITDYYDRPHFRLVNGTAGNVTCWVKSGGAVNEKFKLPANGTAYAMPDSVRDRDFDLEFWEGSTKIALAEGYKLEGYYERVATLTKSGDKYSVTVA